VVQIFKQHRWWWTIYQNLTYDENGDPILPFSEQKREQVKMRLYRESFAEHNFLWTQWKKLKHFNWLTQTKVPEATLISSEDEGDERRDTDARSKEEESPAKSQKVKAPNISNALKVYAKLEHNYHLSNKYALFYNMRKYFGAHGRDPFTVLPVTFHIKTGVRDPVFIEFLEMYNGIEAQRKRATKLDHRLEEDLQKMEKELQDHL
jgi:hypothetical protein